MAALIFVDDAKEMTEGETEEEVQTKAQVVKRTWKGGLIVIGRGLRPPKCLWQMTSLV